MTVKLTVRLEDELNDHLTTITQILNITKNAIIKDLLEKYVIDMETNPHYIAKREDWTKRANATYGA
jgi:predicted DNA-binding protein